MFKNIEQKNINIVRLEVRSSNISALKLYKSNGFIESGIRKDYYNNPNEDAIIMEKKIC
jgi:ribosomal-protein-alanine acetyltransferase